MKNVLVAIDFHKKTEVLIDWAFSLTKPHRSKLWLIHVAAPDPDFVGNDVGPQYIRDDRAETLRKEHRLLQRYKESLEEKGTEVEALLIQGATIETILEEADKLSIELIACGHHQHGFLYNAIFGSTSSGIVNKSSIPVLVFPFDD